MRTVFAIAFSVLAPACSVTDSCKDGTVLLTVALSGGAEAADFIDVTLAAQGGPTQTKAVVHGIGKVSEKIEVDFAAAYPAGQSLAFTITARVGTQTLALATQTTTATAGCTALSFALDEGQFDFALSELEAVDLAMSDSAVSDFAMPDLFAPSDLAPPPPCKGVAVTTLAGNGTVGFVDGTLGATGTTEFKRPYGVTIDPGGNVIVTDVADNRIRMIRPGLMTTTVAGNGTAGYVDGSLGANGTAEFNQPQGIAIDLGGNSYVADYMNNRIRKIPYLGSSTTTLAGNGTNGLVDGTGGPTGTAEFSALIDIGVNGAGLLYVTDGQRVRKVATDGATTTLAGNGMVGFVDGTGGPGGTTEFDFPYGIAVGSSAGVYVAEYGGSRIRNVAPDGSTTTLAGNGTPGAVDGTGGASGTAEFNRPSGAAVDGTGNVFVVDAGVFVRKIAPNGSTTTVAGMAGGGFADGDGCSAAFSGMAGIAVSGKIIIVADTGNSRVRQIQLP